MDELVDGESRVTILRSVAAYRELCRSVRKGATLGLFWGIAMLAIWYFLPDAGQFGKYTPFGLIYLGLAGLEFTTALWKFFAPSAESIVLDGIVLLAFGGSTLYRLYLQWQANVLNESAYLSLGFAAFMIFRGLGTLRNYGQLRRAFSFRPTREHIRWFDDLLRDVRNANPELDPNALDIPTSPPVRAKLLGDIAVFLVAAKETPIVASIDEVEIERRPPKNPDRPAHGYLFIGPEDFGDFPLDPDNWRNYERWRTAGGRPPAPPVVRPAR